MSFRRYASTAVCGMLFVGASTSFAQQNQNQAPNRPNATQTQQNQVRSTQPAQSQGSARAGEQANDQTLAGCVAIANQEEIALAKMAEEKASSKEVKEFARMLVKDHESFLQKLHQYSPAASQDGFLDQESRATSGRGPNRAGAEGAQDQAATQIDRNTQNAGQATNATAQRGIATASQSQGADRSTDLVQLQKEIAQECLKSSKEKLSSKSGPEFDQCFINAQVEKHAAMKDKLTVFKRHVSEDLAQVLADGLKTTESHMKKAEEIAKELDSASSRSKGDRQSENKKQD